MGQVHPLQTCHIVLDANVGAVRLGDLRSDKKLNCASQSFLTASQPTEMLLSARMTFLQTFLGPCAATNATTVHIAGPEAVRARFTFAELLPESLGPDHLRIA